MKFNIRYILLLVFILFKFSLVYGQRDSLMHLFDERRISDQKKGMLVLGSWAVGNIATGLALNPKTKGEDAYFHQMNVLWNSVNLSIAAIGYMHAKKEQSVSEPMSVLEKQLKFEKSLLFNTGLDLAYIATGALLLERSRTLDSFKKHNQYRGYGRSIVLQGSFLFLFDLSYYIVESASSKELNEALKFIYATPNSIGIQKSF